MGETSDISELLAYLLVSAMATAILLPFLRPVLRQWAGTARASRVRAAISAALLFALVYFGGSTDKQQRTRPFTPDAFFNGQPSLRTDESPSQPQWYVDLGYPTTDTDGDGIPDYWERRTHTDPSVADAANDPDDDGVDNSEEFLHQCDPVVVDTDGDGLTDREEIDGAAAGWTGFNPISRCAYDADVSDANAWEDEVGVSFYEGQNSAGFPWNVGVPDASAANVDVCVTVDSSRYAELSWMTPDGAVGLVLPPCTNLALRLRIPATENSSLSLSPAPGATGPWRAGVRAEWRPWSGVDREGTRVKVRDGAFVDIEGSPDVFAGILPGTFAPPGEPTRGEEPRRQNSNVNAPPLAVTMYARRATSISMSISCVRHGPNPAFTAIFMNPVPPFRWKVNGAAFTTFIPELNLPFVSEEYFVECHDSGFYTRLPLGFDETFSPGICQDGPETNIIGAAWSSTHDYEHPANHEPAQPVGNPVQFGPQCPVYTNWTYSVGWKHQLPMFVRDLIQIVTNDSADNETDHGMAIPYLEGNAYIDLRDYLNEDADDVSDRLSFLVGGYPNQTGRLFLQELVKPEIDDATVVLIDVVDNVTKRVLDSFWLVIYNITMKIQYVNWVAYESTHLQWVSQLPRPPAQLDVQNTTPPSAEISDPIQVEIWSSPKYVRGNYLHHNAVFAIRTRHDVNGHGNQACYDEEGRIILSTIAAGTADFGQGDATHFREHVPHDVLPFYHALWLDGNPGARLFPMNSLSRPCIRQGTYLNQYLLCRPPTPPEDNLP